LSWFWTVLTTFPAKVFIVYYASMQPATPKAWRYFKRTADSKSVKCKLYKLCDCLTFARLYCQYNYLLHTFFFRIMFMFVNKLYLYLHSMHTSPCVFCKIVLSWKTVKIWGVFYLNRLLYWSITLQFGKYLDHGVILL
jgi:hypothetical protein